MYIDNAVSITIDLIIIYIYIHYTCMSWLYLILTDQENQRGTLHTQGIAKLLEIAMMMFFLITRVH